MAAVLADRGDTALVFRGDDGLDELTTTTTSQVWVAAERRRCAEAALDPRDFGIAARRAGRRCAAATAAHNAAVVREVLAGGGGAVRDAVAAQRGRGDRRLRRADRRRWTTRRGRPARGAAEAIDCGAAADAA